MVFVHAKNVPYSPSRPRPDTALARCPVHETAPGASSGRGSCPCLLWKPALPCAVAFVPGEVSLGPSCCVLRAGRLGDGLVRCRSWGAARETRVASDVLPGRLSQDPPRRPTSVDHEVHHGGGAGGGATIIYLGATAGPAEVMHGFPGSSGMHFQSMPLGASRKWFFAKIREYRACG